MEGANAMKKRKVIDKRIRITEPGLDLNADINVVMSANVGGRGERTATVNRSGARRRESARRRTPPRPDAKPKSTE
jgi:hypothetical protein